MHFKRFLEWCASNKHEIEKEFLEIKEEERIQLMREFFFYFDERNLYDLDTETKDLVEGAFDFGIYSAFSNDPNFINVIKETYDTKEKINEGLKFLKSDFTSLIEVSNVKDFIDLIKIRSSVRFVINNIRNVVNNNEFSIEEKKELKELIDNSRFSLMSFDLEDIIKISSVLDVYQPFLFYKANQETQNNKFEFIINNYDKIDPDKAVHNAYNIFFRHLHHRPADTRITSEFRLDLYLKFHEKHPSYLPLLKEKMEKEQIIGGKVFQIPFYAIEQIECAINLKNF